MASRLARLLAEATRRADSAVGREIGRESAKLRNPGDAKSRRRAFDAVERRFREEADASAVAIAAELDRLADAEARRVAAEIEARTGERAVAPTGTVDKARLREDLRRSNARRAASAVGDMKRGVRAAREAAAVETDGRKANAAKRRATRESWAETARNRRRKRFVDSRGHVWKDGAYNAMRARTMRANALRSAQLATLRANGYRLARITDGATDTTCDDCHLWRGGVVSITGRKYRGYPTLESVLRTTNLFHPNCIHFLEPEELGRRKRGETPTPAKPDSPYLGTPRVYASLAGRPEIDAVIVERDGKRKLASLDWRQRPANVEINVGAIPSAIAAALKEASRGTRAHPDGIDVSGWNVIYDTDFNDPKTGEWRGLAHAWYGHGTPWLQRGPNAKKAKKRGQPSPGTPISFETLQRLPALVNGTVVVVFNGNRDLRGKGRLLFNVECELSDGTIVQGFAIDEQKRRILFKTAFYKEKPTP